MDYKTDLSSHQSVFFHGEFLNKMFFTICGSTAVETAIKIAVAYHRAKGNAQRFRFVGRERGYHGMNIGCVSVGGMVNNVKTFASILMPGVQHIRHTHLPEHKFVSGQPETGDYLANDLETICANFGGENIAACIVEPIAGSTGTLVPPKGYFCLLYTSPSPRDLSTSRMPSSA